MNVDSFGSTTELHKARLASGTLLRRNRRSEMIQLPEVGYLADYVARGIILYDMLESVEELFELLLRPYI